MRLARSSILLLSILQRASAENMTFSPLHQIQQFFSSNTSTSSPNKNTDTEISSNNNMPRLAPVISLSHGGGPLPLLNDPSHRDIIASLKQKVPAILKLGTPQQPRAIVLVTAHWSTEKVTISNKERPGLLFDYYGFPPETYKYTHDAPGSPEIAKEVENALKKEGLDYKVDGERDWDHGVFVPMKLIDPKASIPIIQLSVLASESPTQSYAIGRALYPLRAQNIAIIGSGFTTFHNLRLMFSPVSSTPQFKQENEEWSRAVTDAATTTDIVERGKKLEGWRNWPNAWQMHPRGGAEHFLPLIVCAGAGGQTQAKKYADKSRGLDMWSYYWDEE